KDLRDQPEVQAEICNTIGEVYRALGQFNKAEEMHRGARSLQDKASGSRRSDVATSLSDLALVLRDRGKFPEAESLFRQALAIRRKVQPMEDAKVAATLNNLATVLRGEESWPKQKAFSGKHWRCKRSYTTTSTWQLPPR